MSVTAAKRLTGSRGRDDGQRSELSLAFAAMRARLGLVALLLALTGFAWWLSGSRMSGMSGGAMAHPHASPMMAMSGGSAGGAALGTLGWFAVTWVVMMAAMMFPSLAPTVALYARMTRQRGIDRALLFAAGYLVVWGLAGVAAYGIYKAAASAFGGELSFDRAGGAVAAAAVLVAAIYQFTPLKHACLGKCRRPLGFILGSWHEGRIGAFRMGSHHALWCFGCCWALMVALFALGIMSLTWMAVVAAVIALEKTVPWRRLALGGTSLLLFGLAGALAAGVAT